MFFHIAFDSPFGLYVEGLFTIWLLRAIMGVGILVTLSYSVKIVLFVIFSFHGSFVFILKCKMMYLH